SGMTHANSCCGYFRHPALEKAVNYGLDKAQSVVNPSCYLEGGP
ncbi:MAG: hypothetical protein AVDCRST_MAG93-5447, partial [uncultured Chloroflexia bacterium]